MLFGHALPRAGIAILERQALGVGAVGENDRIAALAHRPKHVRPEHEAVVHADLGVPFDADAVAQSAAWLMRSCGRRCHANASGQASGVASRMRDASASLASRLAALHA